MDKRDMPTVGKVYLVGAGPGDPGLLTLRGRDCLAEADCVIYDYLANDRLLDYAPSMAERIFAGKHGGGPLMPQEEINRLMVDRARSGMTVTRLKGGDPFIFGRGGEEAEALAQAGIPFEMIPGVSAAIAVPAYAGIPLTHRDFASTVAFVTGYEDPQKTKTHVAWDKMATGVDTLVIFMGMRTLPLLVDRLIQHGRPPQTPIALIRWGSLPVQQTITGTLMDIAEKANQVDWKPPVIIVVGEVVKLREKIQWFEKRPLFGKCVAVTRSEEQAFGLSLRLSSCGAQVVEWPALQFESPDSWDPVDRALSRLSDHDWILFTSATAVRFFMERLQQAGGDSRRLSGLRVCAVGPKTAAALRGWGIGADLIPKEYRAEGVLKAFQCIDRFPGGMQGRRILFPRAKEGREILVAGLTQLGARVELIPVYQTVKPAADPGPIRRLFREEKIDLVTFTSPATARNFVEMLGENEYKILFNNVAIACISPVTAKAVEDLGLRVAITAAAATVEDLVLAVTDYFSMNPDP